MTMSERTDMPDRYRIHARQLYPGGGQPALADRVLEIEAGNIISIHDAGDHKADVSFDIVAPGFIDLQINGQGACCSMTHLWRAALHSWWRPRGQWNMPSVANLYYRPRYSYTDAMAAVRSWEGLRYLVSTLKDRSCLLKGPEFTRLLISGRWMTPI